MTGDGIARSAGQPATAAREPAPGTPLEALGGSIGTRILNQLLREGFTTVEQVAACSDVKLLEMRHIGTPSLTSIRDAITALYVADYPTNGTVVLAGEQVRELVTLLSTLAVYADARGRHDVARLARAFLERTFPSGLRPAPAGTTGRP